MLLVNWHIKVICVCEVKEYKADMKYWVADREHKSKNNDSKWFYVDRDHKADKIIFWSKEYQANLKVCEVSKTPILPAPLAQAFACALSLLQRERADKDANQAS